MPTYIIKAPAGFSITEVPDQTEPTPPTQPIQPPQSEAKRFGFIYPNFTPTMTASQFVGKFDASMHNPKVYRDWITQGTDIRKLNPNGVYLKHINLRTIIPNDNPNAPDHPDYNWIHQNHPEWIIKDANGKTVPLFLPEEECMDFGNDAYLDYCLNTWLPNQYLDETDKDPNKVTFYLQDNGNFKGQNINCGTSNPVCSTYTTDAGMQSAWKHMLDRWRAKWPNKKIFVNTGPTSYETPEAQLPRLKDVLAHADGYFSESLTSDHVYWSAQPNNQKRNALEATMQLADWLADNGKFFFPNLGPGDGVEPTQAETDYGYAFFNLMRKGDKQFYSQINKNATGLWVPKVYPEMTLALGLPSETRTLIAANVYRRKFAKATAYVNLSDASITIPLSAGTNKNSLGAAIASPLTLGSFKGLTIFHY